MWEPWLYPPSRVGPGGSWGEHGPVRHTEQAVLHKSRRRGPTSLPAHFLLAVITGLLGLRELKVT